LRVDVKKPEAVIGQHAECDIVLQSSKASRRHAKIVEKNGKWEIEDLKSTNGTFVNGAARERADARRPKGRDPHR